MSTQHVSNCDKPSKRKLRKGKGKGSVQLLMEIHLTVTATECHLPYGITQCYFPPDTREQEHTPPSPQRNLSLAKLRTITLYHRLLHQLLHRISTQTGICAHSKYDQRRRGLKKVGEEGEGQKVASF